MKQVDYPVLSSLIALIFLGSCAPEKKETVNFDKIEVNYPSTRMDTVVDDYHGSNVKDPYRWLEDDNSDETIDWVNRQSKEIFEYIDQIPFRDAMRDRLKHIWNYEKYGVPFKRNERYYFFKNNGLQNQSVMYVQDDLDAPAAVFLDPNKLSDDGTTALGSIDFSKDGKYFAYTVSEGGSDWRTAYVKDLETGELLSDKIEWIKFSGLSFYGDGFFYSRYPEPSDDDALSGRNQNQKVYFHEIGTDQSEDEVIYQDAANPNRGFGVGVTEDEKFMTLFVWESTSGNALYFKDLTKKNAEFVPIYDKIEKDFNLVEHLDGKLYVMTNYKADKSRLIAVDPAAPSEDNWQDVIVESENPLKGISVIGGQLVARYLKNASTMIQIHDYDGKKLRDLELPGIGTVGGFSGKKDEDQAFYTYTSFNTPPTIYKYDMPSGKSEIFKKPELDFDPSLYETKQIWFKSKDGTDVPIFVTHRKGLKLDGKRPTLLYGYGGFDISINPSFSITRMVILENDGVYAVANIRGGGEFGAQWHEQGTKERKQNVFDDFIGAAEHLISEGYTSSEKLAIEGGSNGGLLVGACMTQRPDLFAVAIPRVGVLDMLRYHEFTIGRAWSADYGLSEDPDGYEYLKAYSPLHNVKDVEYPATMVMTADHDDRVVPAHSFKFASELQAHQQGDNPVLIRIEKSAGHGAGKPTDKVIDEAADVYSFMFYNMNENIKYDIKG